jgi:hypothetical protein
VEVEVAKKLILDRWEITEEELTKVLDENPSLRGMMMGYVGEQKVTAWFKKSGRVSGVLKYDDHDRSKKGDISFQYKGHEVRVEVKGLQTNTVKDLGGGKWKGTFQCDASDRRPVRFPDGHTLETTCLLVGEFDLLAVNLFGFGEEWRYAFALNSELPRSKSKKYTEYERERLLSSSMKITWPLELPFHASPWALLDHVSEEKRKQAALKPPVVVSSPSESPKKKRGSKSGSS